MGRETPFNGECGRELHGGGHLEESVYCVQCGAIFVSNTECHRSCPSCTLAEMIEELMERVEQLDRDIGIVDQGAV